MGTFMTKFMSYTCAGLEMSERAVEAEERGLRPVMFFAKLLRIAASHLATIPADEWHHTGRTGKITDFYTFHQIYNVLGLRNEWQDIPVERRQAFMLAAKDAPDWDADDYDAEDVRLID